MKKIFISTSSFGEHSTQSLELLDSMKIRFNSNKKKRKLNQKETIKMLDGIDGVIAGTELYSKETLISLPQLKVISRMGVGIDNIDVIEAKKKNIKIFNTTISPAPAVAELSLGLIIDLFRKISLTNSLLKKGKWSKKMGHLIRGKKLGIIGLGTTGKELVKISKSLGVNFLAFDNYQDSMFAKTYDVLYTDLEYLLKNSDIISIHLNLTDETFGLINKEKINLIKPSAILINTSRGEIIDENYLFKSLKSDQISGAALDVFINEPYAGPLTKLDNVILTPHIGSYAKEIRIQMELEATQNLIKGLK